MNIWQSIDKMMIDGPFKVRIQYRYSDTMLEDLYPDDTEEQINSLYRSIDRHESSLFDTRLSYIYNNHILSTSYRNSYHYEGFPEDAILEGLEGEVEMMMVEAKEEAIEKAKELLDNLQNDFGEAL